MSWKARYRAEEQVRTANTKRQVYRTYEWFYVGDSIRFGHYGDVPMADIYNPHSPGVAFKDGTLVRATYLYTHGTNDPLRIVEPEIADTSKVDRWNKG